MKVRVLLTVAPDLTGARARLDKLRLNHRIDRNVGHVIACLGISE